MSKDVAGHCRRPDVCEPSENEEKTAERTDHILLELSPDGMRPPFLYDDCDYDSVERTKKAKEAVTEMYPHSMGGDSTRTPLEPLTFARASWPPQAKGRPYPPVHEDRGR